MTIDYFGPAIAARYDADTGAEFDPMVIDRTADALAGLAADAEGAGSALEFAIGTGRIALPLSARGVRVCGIDMSEAMLGVLASKPGADRIEVTIGDMSTALVAGEFDLVYLVFNTVSNLTTQDAQVACFANAARHLRPGGVFVVETGIPQLQRLPPGERFVPFDVSDEHLGFDEYDVVTQGLISHHYDLRGGGVRVNAVPFRYVWPAELDLMARLAGMTLVHRWNDWDRSPFDAASTKHISVWGLAGPADELGKDVGGCGQ